MVKVAHICTSRKSYKILEDKLVNLSKLGYEISIISSKEGDYEGIYKEHGIKQYYINMSRKINIINDINSIINMTRLIKKEKFDIVHTHTAKAGIIGRISGKLSKTKVVIHTTHGLPFFEGQNKVKYNIYKFLERVGAKFCDYIGSQNYEDLKKMKSYVREEKLFYEGNGVDLNKLDCISSSIKDEDLISMRKEMNISSSTVIFLKAARLEDVKNHDMIIDALYKLKNKGFDDFCCLFAGEGEKENELKQKVKDLNLEEKVLFLGQRNDIYKLIKMSDISILTSKKEGLPRIIMESMAFYKPVIATNVLGTRELVTDKENGLLSTYNDVDELVEKLEILYRNKRLRKTMGENGRKKIENNFTEQIVAKRIDSIYKLALNNK